MTDTFGQDVRCKTCRSSMFATSGTFFCLSDMKRCLYFGDYHPGERFDKRCHYSLWEPKEAKVKYKVLKQVTFGAIAKAQKDNMSEEFLTEYGRARLRFPDHRSMDAIEPYYVEMLAETKPTWAKFLEKHGFIAKEFEPFDVVIRVYSEADAVGLLNSVGMVRVYMREQIESQLKAHGIEV